MLIYLSEEMDAFWRAEPTRLTPFIFLLCTDFELLRSTDPLSERAAPLVEIYFVLE